MSRHKRPPETIQDSETADSTKKKKTFKLTGRPGSQSTIDAGKIDIERYSTMYPWYAGVTHGVIDLLRRVDTARSKREGDYEHHRTSLTP